MLVHENIFLKIIYFGSTKGNLYTHTNMRRLKYREKKADTLENLGSKERHDSVFSRFSFCLIHPRHGVKEVSNLDTSVGANKISLKSSLLLLDKEPGKGQPSKTKNKKQPPYPSRKKLLNNCSTQLNIRKDLWQCT